MTFVNGNQNHSVGTISDLEGVRAKIVVRAEIQKLAKNGFLNRLIF